MSQSRRNFFGSVAAIGASSTVSANAQAPAAQPNQYELANDKIAMVLDAEAHLVKLTNRQTGSDYVNAGKHAPWRMYYRSGSPMTDGALDLTIDPDAQKPEIRRETNSLAISYKSLTAHTPHEGQTRELQVGLTLHVALQDDALAWTATVENRETDKAVEITELWIPWLAGIGNLGQGQAADVLYWPESAGRRIENPYNKLTSAATRTPVAGRRGDGSALQMTYPFLASMQWFALNNGTEGLYVGSHDKTLMSTCLRVSAERDGTLSASIVKYPFVKAGESWTSEQVVVRLHRGDWHTAAKTYRTWTDTWMQKPNPPQWVRRTPGWMLINMKLQSGHYRGVYADLLTTWQQAQSVGIHFVNYFGWVKQGFDNLYPEYSPDEGMGGAEGLKKVIAQIKNEGGRTMLYTQGQLVDPSTEFYRTKGKAMVARDIWGFDYLETYGGGGEGTLMSVMRNKYFAVACPSAKGWYEQLTSQFEMVKSYGAQGMLFDQMGGRPPYICFSHEHPHSKPSLASGPGKVHNMQRLRKLIKAYDPEFAFIVELTTDCYMGWVDMIHSYGIGFWPEAEAFGEMLRYTFPEPVITNREAGPTDRRSQLGYSFTIGWRIDANPRDATDPGLARYLSRINALRAAHSELLLEGRFVDNENFLCDNSQVASHAHVNGDQMAVTLWNSTELPQKVRVVAPEYKLKSAEWQDARLSGTDQVMMPGDIAVQIFQRANG